MTPKEVLDLAWKKHLYDENKERKDRQEKCYYYYTGDEDEIKQYLTDALSLTYDDDSIEDMQLNYINLVQKLVKQMRVIYKKKPERYLIDKNGSKLEDQTNYYLGILPEDLHIQDKKADRYAGLFGTSLTQVYFADKKIRYRVHASQNLDIKVNDEDTKKPDLIAYDKYYNSELYTIVYTEDGFYKLNQDGKAIKIEGNPSNKNPFKVIPFARYFAEDTDYIWGEGLTDVVNVNEQVNFLLTKLINRDLVIGSEGTVLATNCGLFSKTVKEDGTQEVRMVKIGIKDPITVENVRTDQVAPSIQHISFQPQIQEIRNTIDYYIKLIAISRGLNPNSFLADVQATSGYSKIVDSLEQLEFRQDGLEYARCYEQERFEITRKVNNYYATTKEGIEAGLKEIPEDVYLVVDFSEVEIPRTPQEVRDDYTFQLQNNLTTPAHILMDSNSDLDLKAAKETIEENRRYNDTLRKAQSLFDKLINKEGKQNEQTARQ